MKKVFLVIMVLLASVMLNACGGGGGGDKCEQAYNKVKSCMNKISDCTECDNETLGMCTFFKTMTYQQACQEMGDCTCAGEDLTAANNILAATQTPENCCTEGMGE